MYGIKETKELLQAGLSVIDSIASAREDGEITFMDAVYLGAPIKDIGAGLKNVDEVKNELLDLTDDEQDELADMVLEYIETISKKEAKERAILIVNWVLDGVQIASTLAA